jgi:protein-disulfide isomerase
MAGSQSKFYGALALILIVGAALIGYVMVNDRRQTVDPEAGSVVAVPEDELVSEEVGVSIGEADAAVLIEEYADYLCPYCGMVASLTIPQIMERYVQTGKARFVFFDFPVHPGDKAVVAAEAARCAGEQDAFWAMNKVLMTRMREWGDRRDPRGAFEDYADALGLDGKAVRECVDAQKYRQVVMTSQMRARQLGLNATPTFIINGRPVGEAMGFDQMAAVIEAELAKQ